MLVQFRCQECGERVTSEMSFCPKCGAELPEFEFPDIYDDNYGLDEVAPEPIDEQSVRYRLAQGGINFGNHLLELLSIDDEVNELIRTEGKHLKTTDEKAYRKWQRRRTFSILAASCGYLFLWLPLVLIFTMSADGESFDLPRLIVGALMPLYGVSLWFMVREDDRNISLTDKLMQWSVPAFNKLILELFLLALLFMVITAITSRL